jgi:hypothetical protein
VLHQLKPADLALRSDLSPSCPLRRRGCHPASPLNERVARCNEREGGERRHWQVGFTTSGGLAAGMAGWIRGVMRRPVGSPHPQPPMQTKWTNADGRRRPSTAFKQGRAGGWLPARAHAFSAALRQRTQAAAAACCY